jgi:hypothetical protein
MARGPGKAISSDESVAHVIALDILRHAFVDLAASFGRNDAAAAGAAVESIEQHIANRMLHFRNELPKWIGGQLGSAITFCGRRRASSVIRSGPQSSRSRKLRGDTDAPRYASRSARATSKAPTR